jgi:hypothetical protein
MKRCAMTLQIGLGLMCGVILVSGPGCVREERGMLGTYTFGTAPYVMPTSTVVFVP